MTFAPRTQLHLYLQWVNVCVALSHNCALNVKAVVAASNQYQVPSRGLLRDCEIFANIRFKLYGTYTSARRYHRSRELGNYFQSNYLVATNSDFDRILNTKYYSFLGIYEYRIIFVPGN